MAIAVPLVLPSKTPERISTRSPSLRAVLPNPCPGLLRSRKAWIFSSVRESPAGQPSITTPRAGPWDSPKLAMRKSFPKIFPAINQPSCGSRTMQMQFGSSISSSLALMTSSPLS